MKDFEKTARGMAQLGKALAEAGRQTASFYRPAAEPLVWAVRKARVTGAWNEAGNSLRLNWNWPVSEILWRPRAPYDYERSGI